MTLLFVLLSSCLFSHHALASKVYGFTWPPEQGVNVTQGENVTITWPAQPQSIVKNTTLMIWQGFSNGQGYYETSLLDAVKIDPGYYTWNVQMLNNETSEEDTHFELQYGNGTVLDSGTLYIDNSAYNSSGSDTGSSGGNSGGSSSVGISVGGGNTSSSSNSGSGSGDAISVGLDVGLGAGIPIVIFSIIAVVYVIRRKNGTLNQHRRKPADDPAKSSHDDEETDEKPILDGKPVLGAMEMPAWREPCETDGTEKRPTRSPISPLSPYPQEMDGEEKRYELSARQSTHGAHELPATRQDERGRYELSAK